MTLRIERCSREDLDKLREAEPPRHVAHHQEERFRLQCEGTAVYILAWQGDRNVGRATLYTDSKYDLVRRQFPQTAEINALEAVPQGQGIGTALIMRAEELAAERGHRTIGLAVEPGNPSARHLYEWLGYRLWDHGQVIDEWTERRDDGTTIAHAEPCDYLFKEIRGSNQSSPGIP